MSAIKNRPRGKGRCYEKALKYLLSHNAKGTYLVHGEATGRGLIEGIKYGHAWIEDKDIVIGFDKKNPVFLPIFIFYQLGKIDKSKVKRYTFKQAGKLALKTGHYGPWDKNENH